MSFATQGGCCKVTVRNEPPLMMFFFVLTPGRMDRRRQGTCRRQWRNNNGCRHSGSLLLLQRGVQHDDEVDHIYLSAIVNVHEHGEGHLSTERCTCPARGTGPLVRWADARTPV